MTIALATQGVIAPTNNLITADCAIQANLSFCGTFESPLCGTALDFKHANAVTLLFLVNSDGERLSEAALSGALDIVFALKCNQTDADIDSVLIKYLSMSQIAVLPDQGPTSPNLKIVLTTADMGIAPMAYYAGLAIKFTADDVQEANLQFDSCLFDTININQDVIRC